MIEVRLIEGKGRGVFTTKRIKKGEYIEICPMIVLPPKDRKLIDKTFIFNYYFLWNDNLKSSAIALGYGSLYNHSYSANAIYESYYEEQEIHIKAHRNIEAGEEITINYNCEPDSKELVWFDKVVLDK
ncbi:MAG: SET domain-containing protein-lysine N-methyltransferase [Bacteroidetes bacterium]|nr:SET domain-containing protein-lysine N-methyltransferase [Bacteroidota bacterium]